ncbi:MAG: DUF1571 domain-containing protein [Desulfobacterales bacterium]|nr:DUF1571 domain-containing protein [Desulfobacterales bacterium]
MRGIKRVKGWKAWAAMGCLVLFSTEATATLGAEEPLAKARRSLRMSESLKDYTAVLVKQERFGKRLSKQEEILFKYGSPDKVYMRWIGKVNKGQEALFVAGENKNRLKAHKGGFLGMVTVNVDPRGSMAMEGQHHPILDAGIGPTTQLVLRDLEKGLKNQEVEIHDRGVVKLDGRATLKVEAFFPSKVRGVTHVVQKGETLWDLAAQYNQDMFVIMTVNKGVDDPEDIGAGDKILIPDYYCRRSVSYFDVETGLLIKIENFNWQDELYETYYYRDLKVNVGLGPADFDPNNDEYRF